MSATQVKVPGLRWSAVLRRLLLLLVVAFIIGWTLKHLAGALDDASRPAGFARGVANGALMPLALPNLLAGQDVPIYAAVNTGRTYKLGYTVGVNGCGLLFFGFFFWRVSRWRKPSVKSASTEPSVTRPASV